MDRWIFYEFPGEIHISSRLKVETQGHASLRKNAQTNNIELKIESKIRL